MRRRCTKHVRFRLGLSLTTVLQKLPMQWADSWPSRLCTVGTCLLFGHHRPPSTSLTPVVTLVYCFLNRLTLFWAESLLLLVSVAEILLPQGFAWMPLSHYSDAVQRVLLPLFASQPPVLLSMPQSQVACCHGCWSLLPWCCFLSWFGSSSHSVTQGRCAYALARG